ncbi:MAG: CYTH domain-containing protein [Planctomycetota bacterium]|jgi:adenylate cyclase
MRSEIERKFLVRSDAWGPGDDGTLQRQGYLAISERNTVRVRVEGRRAQLTVKGPQRGLTRAEYEYEIPVAEGEEMLAHLCGLVIEKTRYLREYAGQTWEVDVFRGPNEGLVTAEVELESEETAIEIPPWVGEDVSSDRRYRVAHLSRHPYREWQES